MWDDYRDAQTAPIDTDCALVTQFDPVSSPGEHASDDERRQSLSAFLTKCRRRIDPAVASLAEHARCAENIGTVVTPGEIADAAGIDRRWYELAERGEPVRASAPVLGALGDVFGLDLQARAVLVRLATPCFDRDTPREESLEVRDAFGSLRRYLRKVYSCSTMDEVMSVVQETAATYFPQVSYLATPARLPDGCWSVHGEVLGHRSRLRAFASHIEHVITPIVSTDPVAADAIVCFPKVSLPGDLSTYDDHDDATMAEILPTAFDAFKHLHEPMLAAIIRTRGGFFGHLYLGDFYRHYDSDVDRALVTAIADFASLAAAS